MVTRLRFSALSLVCLAVLAGCTPATAPTGSSPAQPVAQTGTPASDWDRIVADARREGEVIVWVGPGADARALAKDAFEAAYP